MIRKPDAQEAAAFRDATPPAPAHHLRSITAGTTAFADRAVLMSLGVGLLIACLLPFALVTVPLLLIGGVGWWLTRDDAAAVAAAFQTGNDGR